MLRIDGLGSLPKSGFPSRLPVTRDGRCKGGIMKAPVKLRQGQRVRFEHPDREWLHYHYVVLDKTTREIAEEVGTTFATIALWCRQHGLIRSRQELDRRHSERMTGKGNPAWNGGTARNYQARLLKRSNKPHRCIWCGATRRLQVHHMDHDIQNGDIDNLEWLCGPCNRMEAQMHALERAGRATVEQTENQIVLTFREV